jgi:hypothetical protein
MIEADTLGVTPWWMDGDGAGPALCRERWRATDADAPSGALADPGLGPIGLGVDCYLRAVAGALRDGEVVELPHLGRLRLADLGRGVVFEAAPGLAGELAGVGA